MLADLSAQVKTVVLGHEYVEHGEIEGARPEETVRLGAVPRFGDLMSRLLEHQAHHSRM